jgi:hypothetical protein
MELSDSFVLHGLSLAMSIENRIHAQDLDTAELKKEMDQIHATFTGMATFKGMKAPTTQSLLEIFGDTLNPNTILLLFQSSHNPSLAAAEDVSFFLSIPSDREEDTGDIHASAASADTNKSKKQTSRRTLIICSVGISASLVFVVACGVWWFAIGRKGVDSINDNNLGAFPLPPARAIHYNENGSAGISALSHSLKSNDNFTGRVDVVDYETSTFGKIFIV